MTVKELIVILSQMDQDAIIISKGYEGGWDEILTPPLEVEIALNVNTGWFYGKHEKVEHIDKEDISKCKIVNAVII
jgi:hypothetical protein